MPVTGSEHWSEYWAQGRMTSLPQDFTANYDGEVAAFWNEVFSAVPDRGQVLDLCTGNGAIAFLAAAFFKDTGRSVEVTAVDAAEINPAALVQHFPGQSGLSGQINFVGNCRVEELQLPDDSADLVTSQYGIEYCDWRKAAAQVARVLKPGGRFVMVCHTPDSDMLAYMKQEFLEYAKLEESGFFRVVDQYLNSDPDHESLQQSLSRIGSELQPEHQRSGSALFHSVLGLIRNALNMTGAQLAGNARELGTYLHQMQAGKDRLADMLRVNQALDDDPDWTGVFLEAGLQSTREGQIRYRGQHNAGQYYEFTSPADNRAGKQDG